MATPTQDPDKEEKKSAYERLRPFIGVVDSGGLNLSQDTGRKVRQLFLEKRKRQQEPDPC